MDLHHARVLSASAPAGGDPWLTLGTSFLAGGAAASDAVEETRNQALREVALAYDQLDTGLQQYDAARAFLTAAETAFRSATDAYAHGVGTITDAVQAEGTLAAARADVARAHAQSLINAAALAFATGALNASTAAGLPSATR